MQNDDNPRREMADAAASHSSAETMTTADASGFLIEPIHPNIVAFAHLPVPESCDDLPPLHILQGDTNIYEFMVQRADATARVVSQLARRSRNSQTPITTHYATVFQYDVTVYTKIARHARSTARWLLTRCARRSGKDEDDAELAVAADYNTTRALVETARTAAVRLETSLVLVRPALASLLEVVAAAETQTHQQQQGGHRRSRSQTTSTSNRQSKLGTADGSVLVGPPNNKSAMSENNEEGESRSASSASHPGSKKKEAVVVHGTLLHRLQQQARLNSVLAAGAAATTATQHPTPAAIMGRSDGGGEDDVRMSMMPSPVATATTSVGEKAHHRSTTGDEPPAAKRSRASFLPPSAAEAEAAKVDPASHLNTLDEAHPQLSGDSSDDDDDDDDYGF